MNEERARLPFDEVLILGRPGRARYDVDEFLGLPLQDRVALILARRVRFMRAGAEVPAKEALRALRELR